MDLWISPKGYGPMELVPKGYGPRGVDLKGTMNAQGIMNAQGMKNPPGHQAPTRAPGNKLSEYE